MNPAQRNGFASLTLAYNQEDYIEICLRELLPHTELSFVLYSEQPFTRYNPNARAEFSRVDATRAILRHLEADFPHLRVIEGVWDSEEQMRNTGLAAANEAGLECLLIVDADEFYRRGDIVRVKRAIAEVKGGCWLARMCVPYKFSDRIVDRSDAFLPVAVQVEQGVEFVDRRFPNVEPVRLPREIVCFNMGFVLSDERMLEKTRTYSHAHELPKSWFERKWLGFSDTTRNLHTRVPKLWPRVLRFDPAEFPESLHGHPLLRRYGERPIK